jgi:hypothetical protein
VRLVRILQLQSNGRRVISYRVPPFGPIERHKGFFPDFQPIRVSEDPVCIYLFRQKPVFTSLHLRSPVHVVPPQFSKNSDCPASDIDTNLPFVLVDFFRNFRNDTIALSLSLSSKSRILERYHHFIN